MSIKVKINTTSFMRELFNPGGPLFVDMYRRGRRVQARARQLAPRDTGRLQASIFTMTQRRGRKFTTYIYSDLHYALFQHEGTGIYGPRGRMIVARPGKVFVFRSKQTGQLVFTTRVRGVKPTKFLERALPAAAG